MGRYAIIDDDGIVFEGDYDYIIECWNNDADVDYRGEVLFVKIEDRKMTNID